MALGRIASARPDFESMPLPGQAARPVERPLDWPNLQMRLRLLLWIRAAPSGSRGCARCATTCLALVERGPDRALMRGDVRRQQRLPGLQRQPQPVRLRPRLDGLRPAPGWQAGWADALTLAALSMNLTFTQLQDELARQSDPMSDAQRERMHDHPARAADLLAEIGVDDAIWLHAVRHHHSAPAGRWPGARPRRRWPA